MVINYKNWVWVACGLCVNKMTDAMLSSEDEEIENPIETAVSRGASLVEPEKALISRKRKVIVNSGQYIASREHKNPNSKTSVWDRIKEFPGQHLESVRGQLRCNACQEALAQKKSTVEKQVKSKKHLNGISSIARSKKRVKLFFSAYRSKTTEIMQVAQLYPLI